MYSKILVPLDGTEFSEKALLDVLEIASVNNAEVHLLRVSGSTAAEYAWNDPVVAATNFVELEEEARRYIEDVKEKLEVRGVKVSAEVCDGAIAQCIVEVAEKENVDLIAMCTHGRSGITRLLKGSFTDKVVHESPIPVLVLH